ncbi:cytochrome P450 [Thozetella sp. PMI_491]|nr:cytochrome P450 [Thozetella sp. PMI_491]
METPDLFDILTRFLLPGLILWWAFSAGLAWHRLRHVPGPILASFSYLWLILMAIEGDAAKHLISLMKYGSLVRISPKYVLTDDAETLRRLGAVRGRFGRDSWYHGFRQEPGVDSMLSTVDTAVHDRLKAQLASGYGGRDTDLEGGVNSQVQRLISAIRNRHLSTTEKAVPTDLIPLLRSFTQDVITRLGYGCEFGFLDTDDDLYNYSYSVGKLATLIQLLCDWPFFRQVMNSKLLLFARPRPTDKDGMGKVVCIARDIVQKRFDSQDKSQTDMTGSFMRHGLSFEETEAEIFVQMLAGSDTTASALRATMLHIITCPRVYQRLKREIQAATDQDDVASPISLDQARKIPYLQAVIYEGLRMYPPALYGFFKTVPPEGEKIQGVFLPGGTCIGFNMLAVARSQIAFGSDAEVFRPERFLECDEVTKQEMERHIDLAFGYGRWMCAGKTVAFTELNKVIFELLREFDFQILRPGNAWHEVSTLGWIHRELMVSITEANHSW